MVEILLNEIHIIKEKIINQKIINLEYEVCMFFNYYINYIKKMLEDIPELDYNFIKIFNEIKTELCTSEQSKCIILKEEIIKIKKQKKTLLSKKKEEFKIIISEYIDEIKPETKKLNEYQNNCWIISYNFLVKKNINETIYIKRSLYLKLLFAHILTFRNFLHIESDEGFLKCLNKLLKIIYSPSLIKLLENKILRKNMESYILDYEQCDYYFYYGQYEDYNNLILWKLYDETSDTEFNYMKKLK